MNTTAIQESPARLPKWLRRPIQTDTAYSEVQVLLKDNGLNTVCEDAKCPNRHECWNHGTATIMILGNICTRDCSFCSIAFGKPDALDMDEKLKLDDQKKSILLKRYKIKE